MKKFIISDETPIKRLIDGEEFLVIIETAGIQMSRVNKNPLMLFNHNENFVLGSWVELEKKDSKLYGMPDFDEDGFSKEIKAKVDKGSVRGASISIDPLEVRAEGSFLYVTSSIMLEGSIVPLPANENALTEEFEKELEVMSFSLSDETKLEKLIKNHKQEFNMKNKKQEAKVEAKVEETKPQEEVKPEANEVEVKEETPVAEEPKAEKENKSAEEIEELKSAKLELSLKLENLGRDLTNAKSSVEDFKAKLEEKDSLIENLKSEISKFKAEKVDTLLENAIKDGKISPANKEQFLELSYDKAKGIIDNLPSGNGSLVNDLSNMQAKDTNTKDYAWYLKNDRDGLSKISKENPSLYKQLETEHLNKLK
jgi:HK97 family phage prohead protease